jgi:hypothetical protein
MGASAPTASEHPYRVESKFERFELVAKESELSQHSPM